MKSLQGKRAFITGASAGIGRATALRFAAMGADLVLVARRENKLQSLVSEIQEEGGRAEYLALDLADQRALSESAKSLADDGGIDILVNNAGLGKSAPFHRMGQGLWNNMISVNLNGTFYCTREVIGGMLEAGYGRIINLASTAGLVGYEYVSAYCAAKHGVIGLTRSLALETATRGITVNAVCPGYTETDLLHETIDNIVTKTGRSIEETRMELAASNPQKRLVQPWEVAETVAWLALPSSASITGQAISVAGGEVM